MERLQKIISQDGLCSRRQAEVWIRQGRVLVNGRRVTELGTKARLGVDEIKVNGKRVGLTAEAPLVLAFYKPAGIASTMTSTPTLPALDSILGNKERKLRLRAAGHLDFGAQGLLLLTNHSELIYRLKSAEAKVPRAYEVKIRGQLTPKKIRKIEKGFVFGENRFEPISVHVMKSLDNGSWVRIELQVDRARKVRSLFETLGHAVSKVKCVGWGPVELGKLRPGEARGLTATEARKLFSSLQLDCPARLPVL